MKNITKKIVAVFAVLCVASSCLAGCSKNSNKGNSSNDSDQSTTLAPKQYAFSVGSAGDGNPLSVDEPDVDLEGDDPVAGENTTAQAEPTTEIQEVTDASGEPVTEVVEATEADGQPATDSSGAKVTEVVKVTQAVQTPAGSTPTATEVNGNSSSDYKPAKDGRYAMWLDISKDENFFFEDDMIKYTFKVKEGIPDGDYKISIVPDISDIAGVRVQPSEVINGTIRVNNGEIEAVDVSDKTDMIFYGDNIACKQGDTIDFNVNIKNNVGMAAFMIWVYFDSNALEFIDAKPTGEFRSISSSADIGQAVID